MANIFPVSWDRYKSF